ncbi:hypothetical protein BLOT_014759 [Blomia tropicalis]|nr:hypothetical protein BLOT_014759 [Blomia tropicalis]
MEHVPANVEQAAVPDWLCAASLQKELCYYIDDKRPCNAKSVEECIEYLSQYNFAIHQLCFRGFELYKSEAFIKY